jgi:CheY-like chemotaxis protein/rubredoxin
MLDDAPAEAAVTGIRVLVADDDARVRSLLATLLQATAGVASVIEAEDGAEAVRLGRDEHVGVAVLDLNMPGLDGVEAALALASLRPALRIALHSSDPELLRQRAAGLELPLFDKADFDGLGEWVERQATDARASGAVESGRVAPVARKVDLFCSVCGYGIVRRTPPERCPMCGENSGWSESPGRRARRVPLDERLAG